MSKRMWLRATCAAVVLLAAPGLAAAQKLSRSSGPFKIYVGLDDFGQPAYENCGELNLYKTATGREWRLENTCDQLIDVMAAPPVITPTPTPTPTGTGGTPTPGGSTDCPDGSFSKVTNSHWALSNVILQEGKTHVWCADLPATTRPFFEIYTVNKGNASCSDVEMVAVSPNGTEYFSNGSAPAVPPFVSVGRWRIKLKLNYGCTRYDVNISY